MKRVILFDTAIATQNKGDEIIMHSVMDGMKDVLEGEYVYHFPTHLPSFPPTQLLRAKARLGTKADLKFICGTNLFWTKMLRHDRLLNVGLCSSGPYRNSVLLGVGYNDAHCGLPIMPYSRCLWRKILSHDYVHSTRDDATVFYLEKMGLKAVNTGCPTLWPLTPEYCRQIPTEKAPAVVFTLSSTNGISHANNKRIISLLLENYEDVYFWTQTYGGFKMLQKYAKVTGFERIQTISPELDDYARFLDETDTDYVGTRLHGGVFAMQHKRRALVLDVDHRAGDFGKYHIPHIDQGDVEGIDRMIHDGFSTSIVLDYDIIDEWRSQFM